MSRSLNIGVIGCGYWGPRLVKDFCALGCFDPKYLCDLDGIS